MAIISQSINKTILIMLRFLGAALVFSSGALGGVLFILSPIVWFV